MDFLMSEDSCCTSLLLVSNELSPEHSHFQYYLVDIKAVVNEQGEKISSSSICSIAMNTSYLATIVLFVHNSSVQSTLVVNHR